MNEFADNRGTPRSLTKNLDQVYLRLSLTDACNFRCKYCMPADGYPERTGPGAATDDEFIKLVELFSRVRKPYKIRLTGGEPLLHKSIVPLAERLAETQPQAQLCLTTNAVLLPRYAKDLENAGLQSVNVSLDSLDRDDFKALARRDQLQATLAGIDSALEAGMKVKLNAVLIRSVVEKGIIDLVDYACDRNLELRFIELMPLGEGGQLHPQEFISADDALELIKGSYSYSEELQEGATSDRHTLLSSAGDPVSIGFIRTMSNPFCGDCDRMRIDSLGQLYTCIRSVFGRPLLSHLRRNDEEAVMRLVAEAVYGKIIPDEIWPEYRSMVAIGG